MIKIINLENRFKVNEINDAEIRTVKLLKDSKK